LPLRYLASFREASVSWTKQAFDHWYLVVYPHRDDLEAEALVSLLARHVRLPGARFVDLGCGPGRHLRALEKAGARPVGLDASAALLAEAARTWRRFGSAAHPALVRADMRALPFSDGLFDGATSLFTSVGYSTEEDDRRTIAEARRVVRPGGFFVLDFLNRERVLAEVRPESSRVNGEFRVAERRRVQDEGRFVVKRVTIERVDGGGPVADYEERVTLYSSDELRALLQCGGFRIVEEWGDYAGGAFELRSSPRHLLFAVKGEH
jgi:SAM-dependent methyltransferase